MVKMSKLEEDAIHELTSMCSYHTSMALSDIIGKPVELSINSREVISLNKKEPDSDKAPVMFLGIYSTLEKGDLEGNIVFAFPKDSALKLYDVLRKKKIGSTKMVDESVKNVLVELGNVVSGKFLGVLNKFIGLKTRHAIPSVVPSFGNQIYDYVYFNMDDDFTNAILIKIDTILRLKEHEIEGQIILLLSHKSFDGLLAKINDKVKTK